MKLTGRQCTVFWEEMLEKSQEFGGAVKNGVPLHNARLIPENGVVPPPMKIFKLLPVFFLMLASCGGSSSDTASDDNEADDGDSTCVSNASPVFANIITDLYQVCPYDYYSSDLAAQYYAKMGGNAGVVDGITTCQGTSRDVEGSISGTWFLDSDGSDGTDENDNGDYRWRLDIALEIDGQIEIGGLSDSKIGFYNDNATWLDPEEVTTSYCYQIYPTADTAQGYAYFNNVSDTQLQVVYNANDVCPDTFPTVSAVTYYR